MTSTLDASELAEHLAMLPALPLDEQQRLVEQELHTLSQHLPSLDAGITAECLPYVAHIQQMHALSDEWNITFGEAGYVFFWAATVLLQQKQQEAAAEALLERVLTIWERTQGLQDPLVDTVQYNLALLYVQSGKYALAEALWQRIVLNRTQLLRADHPETIQALISLAYVYWRQKKSTQAEVAYQKALTLCKRKLGLEHPLAITVQDYLASIYLEASASEDAPIAEAQYEERMATAERYLQRVSAYYAKKFGAEHLKTARATYSLARAQLEQQKWEQAEVLLQQVRPVYEQHKSAEQPEMVELWYHLAVVRVSQQKWDEETSLLLQKVGAAYIRDLGPNPARTLNILCNLAMTHIARQEWSQAEILLRHAKSSYEQLLGPEHLNTGRVLHTLAQVSTAQRRWDEAATLYEQALAIYAGALGWAHQKTLSCLQHMEAFYLQRGNLARQATVRQQIQQIWEKQAAGPEGPDVIVALNALAEAQMEQGNFEVAENLLQRALTICHDHEEVGFLVLTSVLRNLSITSSMLGKDEQAALFSGRVAQIVEMLTSIAQAE
ncbi:MAG TPA: tetratricopeptide repeat protein [Ktedonobacteraceae bacterium]|jgi:tetratricopeptide (TPR) repeat protein|nr:tetratricopeptide repeat protein [Ktedonobacteraceae bacterium]